MITDGYDIYWPMTLASMMSAERKQPSIPSDEHKLNHHGKLIEGWI